MMSLFLNFIRSNDGVMLYQYPQQALIHLHRHEDYIRIVLSGICRKIEFVFTIIIQCAKLLQISCLAVNRKG